MIKANELRVGNWVLDFAGKPVKVVRTSLNKVPLEMPIPLTPEILLACGFAKGIDNKWRVWDNDSFYIYGSNGFYAPYVMPEIKYLHQLQNIYYWLSGEELEINHKVPSQLH